MLIGWATLLSIAKREPKELRVVRDDPELDCAAGVCCQRIFIALFLNFG
jgi:hypothetical protein